MSKIEWTQETWNPIVGCSVVSPGCTNCYAMRMAARIEAMGTQPLYNGLTRVVNGNPVWTGEVRLNEKKLLEPLKRKKPTTYFVNSMSDLFHASVPYEWIDKVFDVMALTPQHTYQVLTKRPARMRGYFAGTNLFARLHAAVHGLADYKDPKQATRATLFIAHLKYGIGQHWPLPNVWLGVSTEDQRRADERIPDLLATPAAVRFISAEPLLGPINPRRIRIAPNHHTMLDALDGYAIADTISGSGQERTNLDWVIVGGESGPGARPMHPDWVRSLRDQCQAAGVPFFFKQWGNWHPEIDRDRDDPDWRQPYSSYREPHFQMLNLAGGCGFHGERLHVMRSCSKKSAGRTLDGMIHDEYPQVRR